MYETKFEIMQGFEDGIEMFKKLLKPALLLALLGFLLAGLRLIIDPTYIKLLNGQFAEVDQKMRLISQLFTIVMAPITSTVGIMILYYHKEAITEEISLGEKIVSSFKVAIKVFLAIIALFIPIVLLAGILIGISAAMGSYILSMILLILLIIGAIVLSPMFMFVQQAMVFDDMGVFKAAKHSFKLVKHNYFRLLLLALIVGGILMALTGALRFHIVGIILSMMISSIASKLYMCINSSVYLQARPEEVEIYE
ncbi:hypothetical protein EZV73_17525 [Acidaminobacter sp. JC074]|uniref:hypothetical protein n=1 Tax=Acidaminobacter sp. JC074 TaxID=2530199 RepID=UPI001F0DCD33|nr:hypothetical protein [Acidaminobacter sp. JC074]MCH4889403.1 hypothetical protein [Acidaminobacter sp. JC074]